MGLDFTRFSSGNFRFGNFQVWLPGEDSPSASKRAAGGGFEPPHQDPESRVLPLDHPAISILFAILFALLSSLPFPFLPRQYSLAGEWPESHRLTSLPL